MKGYIEVENPETCLDCKFCRKIDEGNEACCELIDDPGDSTLCRMIDVHYCMKKPKWCPIKRNDVERLKSHFYEGGEVVEDER